MSKLTEIMKQIPLDELTGDDEMNRNTIISSETKTENRPALVKSKAGTFISIAACAAVAAGGIFAYTQLSKPAKDETKATTQSQGEAESITDSSPEIISTENYIYRENLETYQKLLGRDYELSKRYLTPLTEESMPYSVGNLSYKMIGYRAVGAFIRIDLAVKGSGEEFFIDPASCEDIKLTLPGGGVISGECVCKYAATNDTLLVSFRFPQAVFNKETGDVFAVNDGDTVTFSAGKLFFQDDKGDKTYDYEIGSYENRFTFRDTHCYEASAPCGVNAQVTPLLSYMSHTEDLKIKEVNYCNVAATVIFTIEGKSDEYRQKVLDELQAHKNDFGALNELVTVVFMDGTERKLFLQNGQYQDPMSIDVGKADDSWEFMCSVEFFDQPFDMSDIKKFRFGFNGTEVELEYSIEDTDSTPDNSTPDDSSKYETSADEAEYFSKAALKANSAYYNWLGEKYHVENVAADADVFDTYKGSIESGFDGLEMRVAGIRGPEYFRVIDVMVSTADGSSIEDRLGKSGIRTDGTGIKLYDKEGTELSESLNTTKLYDNKGAELSESINTTLLYDVINDSTAVIGIPVRLSGDEATANIEISHILNDKYETVAEGSFLSGSITLMPRGGMYSTLFEGSGTEGGWYYDEPNKGIQFKVDNVYVERFGLEARLRLSDDRFRNEDGTLRTSDIARYLDTAEIDPQGRYFIAVRYKGNEDYTPLSPDYHVLTVDESGIITVTALCSVDSSAGYMPVIDLENIESVKIGTAELTPFTPVEAE
ncbi:MAG: hypothetical protein IKN17_04285 [Ruminococcus sp.]|nr:hypothetical protein [Ruminococcus sp.]